MFTMHKCMLMSSMLLAPHGCVSHVHQNVFKEEAKTNKKDYAGNSPLVLLGGPLGVYTGVLRKGPKSHVQINSHILMSSMLLAPQGVSHMCTKNVFKHEANNYKKKHAGNNTNM